MIDRPSHLHTKGVLGVWTMQVVAPKGHARQLLAVSLLALSTVVAHTNRIALLAVPRSCAYAHARRGTANRAIRFVCARQVFVSLKH